MTVGDMYELMEEVEVFAVCRDSESREDNKTKAARGFNS